MPDKFYVCMFHHVEQEYKEKLLQLIGFSILSGRFFVSMVFTAVGSSLVLPMAGADDCNLKQLLAQQQHCV